MLAAIAGINWGDEGKGRMVDLLSEHYDIVVRYQGGNNAGHTVINDKGKFILNLLPSGILRPEVVNVMGNGMVVDIKHLCGEIENSSRGGRGDFSRQPEDQQRRGDRMPYNVMQDCLEEDRLRDKKFGSTRRGIAPIYADKYLKKAIRMGELLHPELLKERLKDIVEWKNLTIRGVYGAEPVTFEAMADYLKTYGEPLKDYICDTGVYLDMAADQGKKVMFEAQLGALREH